MGGCALEAVEAVCAVQPGGEDTLSCMASLVDNSLLRVEVVGTGEPRFGMLETIHIYAAERLEAGGERAVLEQAHAVYFQALAEEAEPALTGPEQELWLARLEREHNNLRAVLQRARDSGDPARGLHLAGTLWRFWYARGHLREGRSWLESLLDLAERSDRPVPTPALAKACIVAGVLANMQGEYARATEHCEQSLALYRALGDRQGVASALNTLGNLAMNQGDFARALQLSEESLDVQRRIGNKQRIAPALNNLGFILIQMGSYAPATALCEESLNLARELHDNLGMGYALSNLGDAAREQGEQAQALSHYAAALPLFQSTGSTDGIAGCLEGIAAVAAARQEPERAAQLCAAASALRDAIGAALSPAGRRAFDRTTASVETALGSLAFAQAWAIGLALSEERSVAEAGALAECLLARPVC